MAHSSRPALKLAVLISGRGSNMLAIVGACQQQRIHAQVARVICDNALSSGLNAARSLSVEAVCIPWPGTAQRDGFEERLAAEIDRASADLIVLAGFMRLLSGRFVQRYAGRILNIHPSLLPRHKGLHPHRRALEAGDPEHGASVHFVTSEVDSGPVVLQSRLKVAPQDTEETLAARVLATEHQIYPQVIGWIADGKLQWREDGPWLDGKPLTAAVVQEFP